MNVKLSGLADEAGASLESQIRAHQDLGWHWIELRTVEGQGISDLPDAAFELLCQRLDEAGIQVSAFASSVANWSKSLFSPEDESSSVAELKAALPRMRRLGVRFLRGMSYALGRDSAETSEVMPTAIRKVRALVDLCEDAGVVYLHENCMNNGGMSWEHTRRLIDALPSPSFRLLFDTGNPAMSYDRRGEPPWKLQDSWEFYAQIREFIDYVHVKDAVFVSDSGIFPNARFTWPGEGNGQVPAILKDLVQRNFDGFVSIEPHLSVVHHQSSRTPQQQQYDTYVAYGSKVETLLKGSIQ